MIRFILGVLVVLAVQAIGWPKVESWLHKADRVTRAAYTAAEHAAAKETGK